MKRLRRNLKAYIVALVLTFAALLRPPERVRLHDLPRWVRRRYWRGLPVSIRRLFYGNLLRAYGYRPIGGGGAGKWSVVIPEAGTNYVLNPSAETTGNFAADGGATVTRSTTYSKFGAYSYRVQTAANADGVNLTTGTLSNAVHHLTFWVAGTIPANGITTYCSTWAAATLVKTQGDWSLYERAITAADASAETSIVIAQSGAGSGDFYIDGVLLEQKSGYYTTYIDGDQSGCTWAGTKHGSTSTRSAQYRGGGKVVDIDDTYGVETTMMSGIGLPQYRHNSVPYALLPGSQFQSIKTMPRSFILTFGAKGTNLGNLHDKRDDLIEAFRPDKVLPVQPVRLRYTGNDADLEIDAHYDGGLEGEIGYHFERIAARFIAYDPMFYTIGTASKTLGTSASVADADYVVKKLDGVWSNISTTFTNNVYAVVEGPDGSIYLAGAFTNIGDANGDYIVKYDPSTGAFTSLGTGMNDQVFALAVAPNGDVYAGGQFTLAGGVANTARIAYWDGSNWNPLSTGIGSGAVLALAFGQDGTLFIGGTFTNHGDANGDYITSWNGSAFASLSTGLAASCLALAVGVDGSLYLGGQFTTAGGVTVNYVVKWNGSAFTALGDGMAGGGTPYVRGLAVSPNGNLYAVGSFQTNNYAMVWNGSSWAALGSGLNGAGYFCRYYDGLLYVGGDFTTAGGLTLANQVAVWNGSAWVHLDITLPASSVPRSVFAGPNRLYIGYANTGTATASSQTTVTNNGSTAAYPKIVIKRSGGTSATLEWIKNETTGQTLYCNYSLLDGETLTIDLDYRQDPTKAATKSVGRKRIYSDFFGNVPRAILRGSDEAEFCLQGGDNTISLYINEAGTPTLTCYMEWKEPHVSIDTVAA